MVVDAKVSSNDSSFWLITSLQVLDRYGADKASQCEHNSVICDIIRQNCASLRRHSSTAPLHTCTPAPGVLLATSTVVILHNYDIRNHNDIAWWMKKCRVFRLAVCSREEYTDLNETKHLQNTSFYWSSDWWSDWSIVWHLDLGSWVNRGQGPGHDCSP